METVKEGVTGFSEGAEEGSITVSRYLNKRL